MFLNNTIGYGFRHFRSEEALRTGVLLFEIVLPIQLVLGTIGNVLSIIVLSRKSMQKSMSCTFLRSLAVADILVLYVCLGRDWMRYLTGDIRNVHTFTCKLFYWLHYSFLDFSVWLLTSLTVERFISICRPLASKIVCTKWHARRIILALLIIDLMVHCHFLFGMELRLEFTDGGHVYECGPATERYGIFFNYAWHYIDLALFSLIPFSILLICNAYIIYKLLYKRRKLAANSPEVMWSSAAQKTSSITKLLVALSAVFLLTTLPIDIYLVIKPYIVPDDVPYQIADKDPWYAFVKILMYVNNCINFILYIASGSKFRGELKKIFRETADRYRSVSTSSRTNQRQKSTPTHPGVEKVTSANKSESW